ncbi:MAG: cold-shock protein, partial [Pseudomonadota bacterium]|nr:cold-shock protein [Pseudomonadota bacterium]
MAQGTVKWFNTQKGYGFINPDEDGNDVFVHITAVQNSGLTGLNEGQRVSYELAEQRNGRFAALALSIVDLS